MNETYNYEEGADRYAVRPARQKAQFIRKTYLHLAFALGLFAALEYFLLGWSGAAGLAAKMTQGNSWLFVLLAIMGVSYLAQRLALNRASLAVQYAGLTLYVVTISVVFMPLMLMANTYFPGAIAQAGLLTAGMVLGLFAVVFTTRADFSFMAASINMAWIIAMAVIVGAVIFGFSLGIWFSLVMIVVASATVLYSTSRVLHDYADDQYVAAALSLFSSIIVLYFYILRALMQRR